MQILAHARVVWTRRWPAAGMHALQARDDASSTSTKVGACRRIWPAGCPSVVVELNAVHGPTGPHLYIDHTHMAVHCMNHEERNKRNRWIWSLDKPQ